MTALTYGIVTTDRLGWGSLGVLGPVAAGVGTAGGFRPLRGEAGQHPQRVPLMPLSVFRLRNLRAANLVIFLLYAAIFGFWFFQSLYMQGTLGYSALETGLAFVPMTLAVGTGAVLAPRLARRFGARCRPRRWDAVRHGRGAAPDRRPSGRHLRGERAARRGARRLRPRAGAGTGDDRRGRGRPPRPQRPRLGRAQHLPLRRRRPRASPCSARSPPTTPTPRSPPAPPPPRRSPTASTSSSASARPSAWSAWSPPSSCCAPSGAASPRRGSGRRRARVAASGAVPGRTNPLRFPAAHALLRVRKPPR